ncbi:MAG: FAD-binding oxidoreductase [Candidatus Moraniibacteriota bacterium]
MEKNKTSTKQSVKEAFSAWRRVLGSKNVLTGEQSRKKYGKTTFPTDYTVLGAVMCGSAAHVAQSVRIAKKFNLPLYPISGGKNWGYGNALPPEEAVVLDLSQMKKISGFDPVLGVIDIEPGVTQQDLYNFLHKKKEAFLVPVHGGGPTCSILGNALERGFGITPYTDHFGAISSIEAILPDGSLYRRALDEMGGPTINRLHPWGLGPYLEGLFTQGNFGIVTSASLLLAPIPEKIALVFFSVTKDEDLEKAVTALQQAISLTGTVSGSFNLMNARRVLSMQEKYPDNVAAPHSIIPPKVIEDMSHANQITAWTGVGAIYGHASMVRAARSIFKKNLGPHVSHLMFLSPSLVRKASRFVRLVPGHIGRNLSGSIDSLLSLLELLRGKPNQVALPLAYWKSGVPMPPRRALDPARDGCGLYWYSPLVPFTAKDVRSYVDMVNTTCERHGIEPLITLTSLSSRCFDSTVPVLFDLNNPEDTKRATRCYDALFQEGRKLGCLPYRLGLRSLHFLKELAPTSTRLTSILKKALDPAGLIAPGRYVFPDEKKR